MAIGAGDLIRLWGKLPEDLQATVVDLVKGALDGKPEVKREHEEALRRALFEARQKVRLG